MKPENHYGVEGKRTAKVGKTHRAGVKGKKSKSYNKPLGNVTDMRHLDKEA